MSCKKRLRYCLFREAAEVQTRLYSVTCSSLVNTVSSMHIFVRNVIKCHD